MAAQAKSPTTQYSNAFPQRHYPQNTRLQRMFPGRFPKNSFFARNNPHPGRVMHIKGLLDVPVCCVQDGVYDGHRLVLSEPLLHSKLQEPGLIPKGATRYSANKDKHIPAVGIVPVTFAWRDELEKLTKQVVANAAMGNPPGKRNAHSRQGSRMQSRQSRRQQHESPLSGLDETTLLELLCRILQTDSIPAIQGWLSSAPEAEKDIVLNMLGMAASGELAYTPSPRDISQRPSSRPASQQVQYSYHWEPNASHTVHESEPIAEECEMMETFGTQKRTSATPKENTCDVSHAEQWLRSHGGSRCRWGGDAVMECNSQMGATSQPPSRLKKTAVARATSAPDKPPSRAATARSGVQRITRSQNGNSRSRFKYVSTWSGKTGSVQEES